jgi:hypothetical protein
MKMQIANAQALQPFTKRIKTESIYKCYKNAEQRALVQRPSGLIKTGEEVRALLGCFRGDIHFV